MESFSEFAVWALGAVASGAVVGLVRVHNDLQGYKLQQANANYIRRDELERIVESAIDSRLAPIQSSISHLERGNTHLLRAVDKLMQRLHIPSVSDE